MKKTVFILLPIIILSIFSCGRDDNYESKFLKIDPIKIQYFNKSSVLGQVLDQNFSPISNCKVKYLDFKDIVQSTQTDDNGIYKIKNKILDKNGQLLTFKKEGYFEQYAYITPKLNQITFANIIQQEKKDGRIIDSEKLSDESFYNNTIEIKINQNSIINSKGDKYNNTLKLYCKAPFLNPGSPCYPDFGIPYSFSGINLDRQNTKVFPLFSMLFQMEDYNDNELFLSDSAKVKLSKKDIPCLTSNDFVIWYFDSTTGQWITLYEIVSSSEILEFKIKETGYYIITDKTDIINSLEGRLLYDDLSNADNIYMQVIDPVTGAIIAQLYSDSYGKFTVYKQENSDIVLSIPKCDGSNYEYKISENSSNLGDIVLPQDFNYKFEYNLESPIANGIVEVYEDSGFGYYTKLSVPVSDSSLNNIDFYGCEGDYLALYDLDNLPDVTNCTPIYLTPGKQISQNEINPTNETKSYFYLNIDDKDEEFFSVNNYLYLDNDIFTFESGGPKATAAVRFNYTESLCHFSYIKIINENDFEVFETEKENPLNFEIMNTGNNRLIGHFYGEINKDGVTKKIDGYFKIPN